MSLENYLASHYLLKKDEKDPKDLKVSNQLKEVEQAKADLEQKVKQLAEDIRSLEHENKEISEDRDNLKSENAKLVQLVQREDDQNEIEEARSQIEALNEEATVLREENGYLKEMTQNLEVENQALEEQLGLLNEKIPEGPCELCETVNKEKNEVLTEVKVELENLRNRLTEINFENYELKDENKKLMGLIGELRENEKKVQKEKTDLEALANKLKSEHENERYSHQEAIKYDQELLKQENQRSRVLEAEIEKRKRREEEKEFQLESLASDLAAMEAQLKISKLRADELWSACQKLEANIKRLEANQAEKDEMWMEELEQLKQKLHKTHRRQERSRAGA
jgi:chromosome segregation ATPase